MKLKQNLNHHLAVNLFLTATVSVFKENQERIRSEGFDKNLGGTIPQMLVIFLKVKGKGDYESYFEILDEMLGEMVQSSPTFLSVLSACSHNG